MSLTWKKNSNFIFCKGLFKISTILPIQWLNYFFFDFLPCATVTTTTASDGRPPRVVAHYTDAGVSEWRKEKPKHFLISSGAGA